MKIYFFTLFCLSFFFFLENKIQCSKACERKFNLDELLTETVGLFDESFLDSEDGYTRFNLISDSEDTDSKSSESQQEEQRPILEQRSIDNIKNRESLYAQSIKTENLSVPFLQGSFQKNQEAAIEIYLPSKKNNKSSLNTFLKSNDSHSDIPCNKIQKASKKQLDIALDDITTSEDNTSSSSSISVVPHSAVNSRVTGNENSEFPVVNIESSNQPFVVLIERHNGSRKKKYFLKLPPPNSSNSEKISNDNITMYISSLHASNMNPNIGLLYRLAWCNSCMLYKTFCRNKTSDLPKNETECAIDIWEDPPRSSDESPESFCTYENTNAASTTSQSLALNTNKNEALMRNNSDNTEVDYAFYRNLYECNRENDQKSKYCLQCSPSMNRKIDLYLFRFLMYLFIGVLITAMAVVIRTAVPQPKS